ncbi:hypothetical protein IT570_09745 [Candidatus Sumerlaeota bacterium]|nr:hypothetical protein [Candidatus Sumerlaeota bacterium]
MSGQDQDKLHALFRTKGNPEVAARAIDAAVGACREPGFLTVTCSRSEAPPADKLEAFTRQTGYDLFTARQRLSSPLPRPLRRDDSELESAKWVKFLRSIGIQSFTASEREITELEFVECTALYKDASRLIAQCADSEKHIPLTEVCCIACGDVSVQVVESIVRERIGGETQTAQRDVKRTMDFVIDLGLRSHARMFRFRQGTFDYSRVFAGETGASTVQIRAILKMIRKALPATPVYDQFAVAESLLVADSAERTVASGDLVRRGAMSGMAMERNVRQERSAFPAFDLYSALARFEVLRGA